MGKASLVNPTASSQIIPTCDSLIALGFTLQQGCVFVF